MNFLFLITVSVAWAAPQSGTAGLPVKVAFFGDQGSGENARAVLRLVKAEGADMVLDQGDFDYEDNPDLWERMVDQELGPGFPYFAALGNHDVAARLGYMEKLSRKIAATPGAVCEGIPGDQASCSYRGLYFVVGAVGMGKGRRDAQYFRKQLAGDHSLWRVCSWHIPRTEMQVGQQEDDIGWDVYEECRKAGALIATAHEHSYSRTHLMADFPHQRIAGTHSPYRIESGRTLAFVSGLGGHSIRSQKRSGAWWASIYTKTQGANYGALFCTFGTPTLERASCYFKDISGNVPDRFDLESGLAPE